MSSETIILIALSATSRCSPIRATNATRSSESILKYASRHNHIFRGYNYTQIFYTLIKTIVIIFLSYRICRTRTNIGTNRVSCATNVGSRWWINNSAQRWKKSIAEIATTLNSQPGVMAAVTYSAQVNLNIQKYVIIFRTDNYR